MPQTIDVEPCPLMMSRLHFCAEALTSNARGEPVNGVAGVTMRLYSRPPQGLPQLVETLVTDPSGACEFQTSIPHREMSRYSVEATPPAAAPQPFVPVYQFVNAGNQGFKASPIYNKTGKAFFYRVVFSLAAQVRLDPAPVFGTCALNTAAVPIEFRIHNDDTAIMQVVAVQVRAPGLVFGVTRALANPYILPGASAAVQLSATPTAVNALQTGFLDVQTRRNGNGAAALEASAYGITAFAMAANPLTPGTPGNFQFTFSDPKNSVAEAKIDILIGAQVVHTLVPATRNVGVNNNCAWSGAIAHLVSHPDGFALLRRTPYTARLSVSKAANAEPCTADCMVNIAATGEVMISLQRHDGAALQGRASFVLTGTAPVVAQAVHVSVAAGGAAPFREECLIQGLAPGRYTIQLQNHVAYLGATAGPLTRIGPAQNGLLRVTVRAGERTRAEYVLSPYTQMQFIGMHALPTGEARPNGNLSTYTGETQNYQDMVARVEIVKQAMRAAQAHGQINAGPNVLKVFMGPEFYFRGVDGGYPLEVSQEILPKLLEEARHPNYADWLFVYGTAIGLLRHEQPAQGLVAVAPLLHQLEVSAYTPEVIGVPPLGVGGMGVAGVPPRASIIRNAALPPSQSTAVSVCGKIWTPRMPLVNWHLVQGATRVPIWSSQPDPLLPNTYVLELMMGSPVLAPGPIELEEPPATEVFNTALVQRGGPNPGGKRELMIYKDAISGIDFLGAHMGGALYNGDANHTADVEQMMDRVLLPTAGALDLMHGPGQANTPMVHVVSEQNDSGIGGGSLASIGGVNLGIEVCVDHMNGRLYKYAPQATPGDSIPQALLIPSWGMDIDQGASYVVPNGLLFNVDGRVGPTFAPQAGVHTATRCPDHAHPNALVAPTLHCPLPHYVCNTRHFLFLPGGNCPRCNRAAVSMHSCTNHTSLDPNCCGVLRVRTHTRCITHGDSAGVACLGGGCNYAVKALYTCNGAHWSVGPCTCVLGPSAVQPWLACPGGHGHTQYTANIGDPAPNCAIAGCGALMVNDNPRPTGTHYNALVELANATVANPGAAYAVNDQTVTTYVRRINATTRVLISEQSTTLPADTAALALPPGPPANTVNNALLNDITTTRTWTTNALAGALTFTCTMRLTTATANNVLTTTVVTTMQRQGNITAAQHRLVAGDTKIHIFPAANLPNAAIA
jgi:hypothetical protein